MAEGSSRTARKAKRQLSPAQLTATGLGERLERFWRKSYAGDYLGVTLLLMAYVLVKLLSEPFHRMFRLDDPRLMHPHAEVERVSVFYLFIYAGFVPLFSLLLDTLALRPDLHKAHTTVFGLISSLLLTSFITDIFKDAIGRPRPDLIARCSPDLDAPTSGLVTIDVCTETQHHLLHDGWRSFPSGHSSFAFAGFGWLSLYIASQTHVLRPRASLFTVLLCLAPLLCAGLVAVSRLEDYRHDVFDVVVGSLLGLTVTFLNWRRYYPALRSKGCEEPYALSVSGRSSPSGGGGGFQRVRDEEEGGVGGRYSLEEDG